MDDVIGTFVQGGWVMIPLLLCSITAATIIIERGIALRRRTVIEPALLEAMDEYAGEDGVERLMLVCRRARSPFARVIEEIVRARHQQHSQSVQTMEAVGRTQVGALERGLTVLEIIAGISPLLGLLGTVLGMVTVFNAITIRGTGNPQVLSAGISEALITTVAGLCVAIPALAFHSWLARRVDDLGDEMHHRATGFLGKVHELAQNPAKPGIRRVQ
jgi:biopolymer transport protein ExbB